MTNEQDDEFYPAHLMGEQPDIELFLGFEWKIDILYRDPLKKDDNDSSEGDGESQTFS